MIHQPYRFPDPAASHLSSGDLPEPVLSFPPTMTQELRTLLQRRESLIADHDWRDRDPSGHLDALKQISGEISAWAAARREQISPRLRHYLDNASFAKALAHLQADSAEI